MEETTTDVPRKGRPPVIKDTDDEQPQKAEKVAQKSIILKNTRGENVFQANYFYSKEGKDAAPPFFNKMCGSPVTREDLLDVFHKVFKPEDNFLFYKLDDRELYIVIVPLKYAESIGPEKDSIDGDFQKHALSFIAEGSASPELMRAKLLRVRNTIKISE